jgi:Asp-tRNA(Asn)/Glu-tRNA(Gln) amidotransferase B subunit
MPELPDALKERLCVQYDLTPYESSVLVNEPGAAQYFETIATRNARPAKLVVNWVLNDLFGHLKATNGDVASSPVQAAALGELIDLIQDGTISGKIAKDVLELMFYENEANKSPLQLVEEKEWKQIQDPDEIRALCRAVLEDPVRCLLSRLLDVFVSSLTCLDILFAAVESEEEPRCLLEGEDAALRILHRPGDEALWWSCSPRAR